LNRAGLDEDAVIRDDVRRARRKIVRADLVGEVVVTAAAAQDQPAALGCAQRDVGEIAVIAARFPTDARDPLLERLRSLLLFADPRRAGLDRQVVAREPRVERFLGAQDVRASSRARGIVVRALECGERLAIVCRRRAHRLARDHEELQAVAYLDLGCGVECAGHAVAPRVAHRFERRRGGQRDRRRVVTKARLRDRRAQLVEDHGGIGAVAVDDIADLLELGEPGFGLVCGATGRKDRAVFHRTGRDRDRRVTRRRMRPGFDRSRGGLAAGSKQEKESAHEHTVPRGRGIRGRRPGDERRPPANRLRRGSSGLGGREGGELDAERRDLV
jgi:hypothetical protein